MANIKFILWTHQKNTDETYPVRLRITRNRKPKYFSFGLSATEKQWDKDAERYKKDKRLTADYEKYNILLNEYENRANDIISDFERNRTDWTLNQFEEKFLNRAKRGKIQDYFQKTISQLKETGHTGNANTYANTLHILQLYDKKFGERIFSEIDLKYVIDFDIWLQKPRITTTKKGKKTLRSGNAGNTRKYYMKTLRSILNMAIKANEGSPSTYPFGKNGFSIADLEEETEKRYLPSVYLTQLKECQGKSIRTETARKLFLFSYYCYGISFIDMAQLQSKNIIRYENGSYIVYKRQKTQTQRKISPIQIKITDEISSLIEWFKNNTKIVPHYILPIVSIEGYTDEKLYKHIRYRYKKYSTSLKLLAKELEMEDINLTSYVSRHTMAMTLQGNNIPREVISQILGHNDLQTTNTYLDSFGSSVIDEAAKVL
ncbi:site-specific integrase [Dysgonomonas sp. 520]|uniref:site-specific integrase n=1 Tax=Dysgonomonas sp. 520 TaxID=2302931 RepID=UPI001626157B|nr:site-specific integrase [Dysgonomonas sp. 520]